MNPKTQTNRPSFNQSFSKFVFITTLSPLTVRKWCYELMQTISTHDMFYPVVTLICLEKIVILGGRIDFANIL